MEGEIIADGPSTSHGEIALGKNPLIHTLLEGEPDFFVRSPKICSEFHCVGETGYPQSMDFEKAPVGSLIEVTLLTSDSGLKFLVKSVFRFLSSLRKTAKHTHASYQDPPSPAVFQAIHAGMP